jgi:hypothetical protein
MTRLRCTMPELPEPVASADGRFTLAEQPLCMCGMRVFLVTDHRDGDAVSRAHVGTLNPYDSGHQAVRELLSAERQAMREEATAA